MKKQVLLITRDGSQVSDRIHYELTYINDIKNIIIISPQVSPHVFRDFINQFKIITFPVIQIQEGVKFITIHMDPNHEEPSQGAGGRTISDFTFVKVNNTDELINKALELYKN